MNKLRQVLDSARGRVALRALLWGAALALIAWLVHALGWRALLEPWQRVPSHTLLLAVILQAASYALRASRLAHSEPEIGRRGFTRALRLTLIHNAANLLLPLRAGEASFPLLMRRWFGVDLLRAGGLLLFLRLSDVQVLAVIALAAFRARADAPLLEPWILAAMLAAALAPLATFVFARRLRVRATRPWIQRLAQGVPADARAFATALAWTWAGWLSKLLGLGLLFAALAPTTLDVGVLAALGGDLSSVLPLHAPAGIGSYEAGALALLAPWQQADAALLAAVVALHVFVLAMALGLAALALLCRNSATRPSA